MSRRCQGMMRISSNAREMSSSVMKTLRDIRFFFQMMGMLGRH
jgi:hypothetical protein